MKKVRKAVIPAAGFGTRFLPATKAIPKEMFPIVDTPALQYVVEEAVHSGITEILIILGKNKKSIEDHFDRSFELEDLLRKNNKLDYLKIIYDVTELANIHYVRQKEMKGSGNAVLIAETFVSDEPFAVLYGDDIIYNPEKPCLKQLIDAYNLTGKSILGCQKLPKSELSKYGIINPGEVKGRYTLMKGIVEKPSIESAPSDLACMGRFILTPDIFEILKNTPEGKNGEVGLTDAICVQAKQIGAYAYDFEGIRYDIGDKLGYVIASIEYGLRDKSINDGLKSYLRNLITNIK
jgi:UTP--glucose-1-phosphate uridylyltransferase